MVSNKLIVVCVALCFLTCMTQRAVAAPTLSSFEDELDIVDESYFTEQNRHEEPRPRTVTRGHASWAAFNIESGFVSGHLMNEQACRNFLRNLRSSTRAACMNVHNGRVFYQIELIGPEMP
jgi:hypothetical protein